MKRRPRNKQAAARVPTSESSGPAAYPPTWAVFLVIAGVLWISRYWRIADFGLYEDDIVRIPAAMEGGLGSLLDQLRGQFLLQGQGRPFHDGFILAFSFLAGRLGGLTTLYLFGYCIVALKGCLFYLLLRRIDLGPLFAALGALLWILYPVDTVSQLYLTLSLSGQISLTFFLLASLAYLHGQRLLAYPLIALTLFCYETVYPVFFVIPLLSAAWDRRLVRRLAVHGGILAGMAAAAALLRSAAGATVVETPPLAHLLTWPFRQMAVGVYTAVTTLVARPLQQLFDAPAAHWIFLAPLGIALLVAISSLEGVAGPARQLLRKHGRIAIVGLVMLAFSYALAFTADAESKHGRGTRAHMPGVAGAALLAGSVLSALALIARARGGRLAAEAAMAVLFTGMAGYGLKIQDDYAVNWSRQRAFWTDALRLCPDASEGVTLLLDRRGIKETAEIEVMGWAIMHYLPLMYKMPEDWRLPPVMSYLREDWRQGVGRGRSVQSYVNWAGHEARFRQYHDAEFIILDVVDGELRRHSQPFSVGDHIVNPKPVSEPVIPRLPARLLHSLLALPPDEEPVDYTE